MCALMLLAGFALKAQCLHPWDGRQYSRLCYNDIQPLYSIRLIDSGVFPYVSGDLGDTGLTGGAIEYPVLTGVFMWIAGTFVSHNGNAYLIVSALLLAPFGLLAAYWLARLVGWRALLWAAAPAVILYSFHNWDLLVVAATVAAFWQWKRGHPVWAAVLLGVGGALKIYPAFFLAPLFLEQLWPRNLTRALKVAVAGVGTFVLINLPFVLINFKGWWATYKFHKLRGPNYDSIWAIRFPELSAHEVNLISGALTVTVFVIALGYGAWRARREGSYPFIAVAASMLAGFLLWNKVHSPQYTLWLLPFFVLLNVRVLWWVAYSAADLLVYVGVFRFFYDIGRGASTDAPSYVAMKYGVYGRAVLLAALVIVFLASRHADELSEEPTEQAVVSHPPPTVSAVGEEAPA